MTRDINRILTILSHVMSYFGREASMKRETHEFRMIVISAVENAEQQANKSIVRQNTRRLSCNTSFHKIGTSHTSHA